MTRTSGRLLIRNFLILIALIPFLHSSATPDSFHVIPSDKFDFHLSLGRNPPDRGNHTDMVVSGRQSMIWSVDL